MTLAARHIWWPKMAEAIQKKSETCIPCKVSGESIKRNIPSTEKTAYHRWTVPTEKFNWISILVDQSRKITAWFYLILSIDRYSKWQSASICKHTDRETAVNLLEQNIQLNGIPKTIRTDNATAFTGRLFCDFCKNRYIKLIYGIPYIHTPTGLVKRGVRTLKENLLTNIKAGERFGKALDLSLDVVRKTPQTKPIKSAFELHYGRKPNTEVTNLLSLDTLKNLTKNSVSATPGTWQVPMKTKKNDKGVSNYSFLFLEKKPQKSKFESAFTDKPNVAISGTKHTVTTPNGRILHRKCINKPITDFDQECNNNIRGTGPRGPHGRFTKSPSKQKKVYIIESDNKPETSSPERNSPPALDQSDNATVKKK